MGASLRITSLAPWTTNADEDIYLDAIEKIEKQEFETAISNSLLSLGQSPSDAPQQNDNEVSQFTYII